MIHIPKMHRHSDYVLPFLPCKSYKPGQTDSASWCAVPKWMRMTLTHNQLPKAFHLSPSWIFPFLSPPRALFSLRFLLFQWCVYVCEKCVLGGWGGDESSSRCMCVCAYADGLRIQKRASDPWSLRAVTSCSRVWRKLNLGSSARAGSTRNHWAISLAPAVLTLESNRDCKETLQFLSSSMMFKLL